ncbi:Viral IAP-associated factor-like protein [Smittium culicis]|uniref:Viral IAP-associated factor-like protein n=1 Tax=Smittium culicis TaxID=133412 RepID=A0A1R1X0K9_9FUNG|nr:Viral IAP-associated factor-like protein [Smittium culicis]OMJ08155.1 Viral IAP-associated factor-like protein [Smittium culicis]
MDFKQLNPIQQKLDHVSASDEELDLGNKLPEKNKKDVEKYEEYYDRQNGPKTGPKSVLADFNYKKKLDYENYINDKNEKSEFIKAKHLNYKPKPADTMWTKKEKLSKQNEDDSSDLGLSELDSGDEIFEEYRRQRIAENSKKMNSLGYGTLKSVSAIEYTDIVEKNSSTDVYIVVLLHLHNLPESEMFKSELEKCAKRLGHIFLLVDATECGFKDHEVLPILLIYKNGELVGNHVKANQSFEFPAKFNDTVIQNTFLDPLP